MKCIKRRRKKREYNIWKEKVEKWEEGGSGIIFEGRESWAWVAGWPFKCGPTWRKTTTTYFPLRWWCGPGVMIHIYIFHLGIAGTMWAPCPRGDRGPKWIGSSFPPCHVFLTHRWQSVLTNALFFLLSKLNNTNFSILSLWNTLHYKWDLTYKQNLLIFYFSIKPYSL